MDAWPTQSMGAEELSGLNEERTRIGTPAYREAAKTSSAAPVNLVPPSHPSQAMRVVVWRGADGVHVAPHGSTVSAITIEAFLVAVDPGADLAAWFSRK